MNKAYSMVAAFSLVMGSILLLPVLDIAYAQYGGSGAPGGVTLEEGGPPIFQTIEQSFVELRRICHRNLRDKR